MRIKGAAARSGRDPEEITLVAVTKTVPPGAVREAFLSGGLRSFGESRVQEADIKMGALADLDIKWHFIGHLQTNKAARALDLGFSLIHSVDSEKLLLEIDKRASGKGVTQGVLIEVNLSGESTKHGVPEEALQKVLGAARRAGHVSVEGLMTIPPYEEDAQKSRPYFRRLVQLRDRAREAGLGALSVLSMGMSNDFEVAIEEGATMVRIGTAIFGSRPA